MKTCTQNNLSERGTAVVIGMFDGLHKGHQQLLCHLKQEAASRGLVPLVVTFERHPSVVFGRRPSEMWLNEESERLNGLQSMGLEYVVLPFTETLSSLSACEFVEQYLIGQKGMRLLLLGYDTRFGNRQRDDFDKLDLLAQQRGFEIVRDVPLEMDGVVISSSLIRNLLRDGAVAEVCSFMGRGYSVGGMVVDGRRDGRKLGFPTANVDVSQCRKLMPKEGVYSVLVTWNGTTYKGMANWGCQPTFEAIKKVLEVHLFGFDGDLYGQQVVVTFVNRIRDIMKFESLEALRAQLKKDMEASQ